jgi:hypothetical protein
MLLFSNEGRSTRVGGGNGGHDFMEPSMKCDFSAPVEVRIGMGRLKDLSQLANVLNKIVAADQSVAWPGLNEGAGG